MRDEHPDQNTPQKFGRGCIHKRVVGLVTGPLVADSTYSYDLLHTEEYMGRVEEKSVLAEEICILNLDQVHRLEHCDTQAEKKRFSLKAGDELKFLLLAIGT